MAPPAPGSKEASSIEREIRPFAARLLPHSKDARTVVGLGVVARSRIRSRVAVIVAAAAMAASLQAWSTPALASSATELVRQAREHENAHEEDLAVRRYTEALGLDPTCEEAYLGLGDLRVRQGDPREAERVYTMALEHAPQLRSELKGRARARRAMGEATRAEQDLEAYVSTEEDPGALRELAGWYATEGRTAAQLAAWRRLLALSERSQDAALGREARTMVRALQILMGPADPVVSPPASGDFVRRTMASIARRGG